MAAIKSVFEDMEICIIIDFTAAKKVAIGPYVKYIS